MRHFKLETCPFDDGDKLYLKDEIEINEGLTVLVGCNGSGKSSLLKSMKAQLRDEPDVSVLYYDNLRDGGNTAKEVAAFHDDLNLLATLITSSEGEQIVISLGQTVRNIGGFVKRHVDECKEIWVMLDAIDSGLSVDNIYDIKKHFFDIIIKDFETKQCNLYLVVVANNYEMCVDANCFDVTNGRYCKFNSYEDYRNFIFESKSYKDNRYNNTP